MDPNVRAKTVNLLENISVHLYDLGLRNAILDMTSNTRAQKKKINWTSSKFGISIKPFVLPTLNVTHVDELYV